MNFPFFIVKKIAFSKNQSFSRFIIKIAIAAVAMSMMVMIIATSLINGFQESISEKVFSFWAHVIVTPYGNSNSLEITPIDKSISIYQNPSSFEHVEHVQATAIMSGIIHTEDNFEGIFIKGVGSDFDWSNLNNYITQGTAFEATESRKNRSILLSEITAKRLKVELDDKIIISFFDEKSKVRKRSFTITGLYNSGLEEFDKKYAIVDIGIIQDLNNWGDKVGGFEVFIDKEYLFQSKFKKYVVAIFGPLLPEEWKEEPLDKVQRDIFYRLEGDIYAQSIKQFRPDIFNWLSLQTANEIVILFIMLLVAAFNMITALLILILERTNMIGIIKSLGADNKQVRTIFMINGAMIILTGIVIGNILGIGLCWLQETTHFITLPEDSYYINYAPVKIDWLWITFLNISTLLLSSLFLLLPTALVSRISPVKAIRFS